MWGGGGREKTEDRRQKTGDRRLECGDRISDLEFFTVHRSPFTVHRSALLPPTPHPLHPMPPRNPSVDGYIRKNKQWSAELSLLREILLSTELVEEIKWRTPCYTLDGGNVAFIGAFKDHCVLSFLKGALLKDPKKILEKPGENTQSARIIRLRSADDIKQRTAVLKKYLDEAIANEKAGLKPAMNAKNELTIPPELQAKFDENDELEVAFTSLTPGRQRAYVMFINGAKQSKTRTARVEKHMQRILEGKGMDD